MTDERETSGETWREVGDQFRALGQSLAAAFRTTSPLSAPPGRARRIANTCRICKMAWRR